MLTITLDQVNAEIVTERVFNVGEACDAFHAWDASLPTAATDMFRVTLCVLVLKNGFVAVGQSACADIVNFDADLGYKFAREDALRQAWPVVMSYLQERQ